MSRDENALSPTYIALGMRRQLSDEHVFEESGQSVKCARCNKRRRHPDHCTREQDKWATVAISDRIKAERVAHSPQAKW